MYIYIYLYVLICMYSGWTVAISRGWTLLPFCRDTNLSQAHDCVIVAVLEGLLPLEPLKPLEECYAPARGTPVQQAGVTYLYLNEGMYVYMYMYICMDMCVCVCVYIYIYICIYIHIYVYI